MFTNVSSPLSLATTYAFALVCASVYVYVTGAQRNVRTVLRRAWSPARLIYIMAFVIRLSSISKLSFLGRALWVTSAIAAAIGWTTTQRAYRWCLNRGLRGAFDAALVLTLLVVLLGRGPNFGNLPITIQFENNRTLSDVASDFLPDNPIPGVQITFGDNRTLSDFLAYPKWAPRIVMPSCEGPDCDESDYEPWLISSLFEATSAGSAAPRANFWLVGSMIVILFTGVNCSDREQTFVGHPVAHTWNMLDILISILLTTIVFMIPVLAVFFCSPTVIISTWMFLPIDMAAHAYKIFKIEPKPRDWSVIYPTNMYSIACHSVTVLAFWVFVDLVYGQVLPGASAAPASNVATGVLATAVILTASDIGNQILHMTLPILVHPVALCTYCVSTAGALAYAVQSYGGYNAIMQAVHEICSLPASNNEKNTFRELKLAREGKAYATNAHGNLASTRTAAIKTASSFSAQIGKPLVLAQHSGTTQRRGFKGSLYPFWDKDLPNRVEVHEPKTTDLWLLVDDDYYRTEDDLTAKLLAPMTTLIYTCAPLDVSGSESNIS
jgi:hypothetical protein